MSKRISILGLMALCAMAFIAFAASSASAAENNTAYTSGESTAIPAGTSTGLQLTKVTNPVLKTKIGLVNVEITSTGIECVECMAQNQEVGGVMDVTGSGGHVKFTGATISTTHCSVVGGTVNTEPLKVTTLSTTKAELTPVTGTVLAVVHTEGAECPLPAAIEVTGHATGSISGSEVTFNTGAGELLVGTKEATLTGKATLSAGVTGGTFKAVVLK